MIFLLAISAASDADKGYNSVSQAGNTGSNCIVYFLPYNTETVSLSISELIVQIK